MGFVLLFALPVFLADDGPCLLKDLRRVGASRDLEGETVQVNGLWGHSFRDEFLLPPTVAESLEGLESAVTDSWGTGSRLKYGPGDYEPIFNVEPLRVWGKTGTAQAPPLVTDVDGDGVLQPGERIENLHHAWFVGLAGETDPRYAMAVFVEHGGSGGRVAGPIANQVIHALRETGHLSGGETAR